MGNCLQGKKPNPNANNTNANELKDQEGGLHMIQKREAPVIVNDMPQPQPPTREEPMGRESGRFDTCLNILQFLCIDI